MKTRYLAATALMVASVALPGAAAFADTADYSSTPKVEALQQTRPPAAPAATAVPDVSGTSLPVTGGDIVGMAGAGLLAVGVGTVLVRRSRRPESAG